jgi:hypothetical protein
VTMGTRLKTAVAFIIFNRPDTTERVFEAIRRAQPPILLVVADGPREDRPEEKELCAGARNVVEGIDWECDVRKNYSETNLGCRNRVSSGLTWVFEQVEEAIIVEDDCLPEPSFFPYCQELLERYRSDERIGHINGTNLLSGPKESAFSYRFSIYNNVWGWASWRRAWKGYDVDMRLWPEMRDRKALKQILGDSRFVPFWTYVLDRVYHGRIDTWDYQWHFHCWMQNRLGIVPNSNLVSNVGFGAGATNTKGSMRFGALKTEAMHFPLVHPPYVLRDSTSDRRLATNRHFLKMPLLNMFQYRLRCLLKP